MKESFCQQTCQSGKDCFVANGARITSRSIANEQKSWDENRVKVVVEGYDHLSKRLDCMNEQRVENAIMDIRAIAQFVFSKRRNRERR